MGHHTGDSRKPADTALHEARVQLGALASAGVAAPPPLTLYVHLPWCIRKCPYCDFNSHQQPDAGLPQDQYIDALLADLECSLPGIWGRTVQAIFIGGGTPSLFDARAVDKLLSGIRARVNLAADAEISMEANPGTFEAGRFEAFSQAGVTRLSIGVQSFNDDALQIIGRVHNSDQARAAIQTAARHFRTYNIDLMFALPGQDIAALQRELDEVVAIAPPHWSCYHLTMEPNTYFANFPPAGLPDDDLAADMLDLVASTARSAGLNRYEISAYARDGEQCRHNLNYWRFGDYLGIGAGAHGKLSFHDRIVRQQRWRNPEQYMQAALATASGPAADLAGESGAIAQSRNLGSGDLIFEFMLNALRLVDGVPSDLFSAHTGLSLARLSAKMSQAADDGLMTADPQRIQASDSGLRFLNDLQMRFLN